MKKSEFMQLVEDREFFDIMSEINDSGYDTGYYFYDDCSYDEHVNMEMSGMQWRDVRDFLNSLPDSSRTDMYVEDGYGDVAEADFDFLDDNGIINDFISWMDNNDGWEDEDDEVEEDVVAAVCLTARYAEASGFTSYEEPDEEKAEDSGEEAMSLYSKFI